MEKYLPQERYQKANIKRLVIKLNRNTDADILSYLETVDNKQGLVKHLLRKWIGEERPEEPGVETDEDCVL